MKFVHTLHGAVDQAWRSKKTYVLKCPSQPHDRSALPPELAQPVWQGCPLTLGITPLWQMLSRSHRDHSAGWRLHDR